MNEPCNPQRDELLAWAQDASAVDPVQDWDLLLAHSPFEDDYLQLASQADCPKRQTFLSVLYLIVGDAVRTGYQSRSLAEIEALLCKGENSPQLQTWIRRSRALIARPDTFHYDDWCLGGWAGKPE